MKSTEKEEFKNTILLSSVRITESLILEKYYAGYVDIHVILAFFERVSVEIWRFTVKMEQCINDLLQSMTPKEIQEHISKYKQHSCMLSLDFNEGLIKRK